MERTTEPSKALTHTNASKPMEKWITENFTDLETLHETELSTTYEARDKLTNEQVLLQVTKVTRSSTFEMFKTSLNLSTKLSGFPHILRTDKVFFDEKKYQICYSTKLGRTMIDILKLSTPFSIPRAVKLLKSLVNALSSVKESHYLSHNNLKPSNIVFIDGVEHLSGWERSLTLQDQSKKITRDTLCYNNFSFLAPELTTREYSFKSLDFSKADVYSLGLLFLYARGTSELQIKSLRSLSGHSSSIKEKIISAALVCDTEEEFETSKTLKNLINQMLRKPPQDRISLAALKQELEKIPTPSEKAEEVEPELEKKVNLMLQAAQNEFNNKNHKQALEIYEKCLAFYKDSKTASEQPLYAHCLIGIGNVLNSQGKLYEANERYSEAQEVFKKKLGDSHPDVATCLFNKATVLVKQNNNIEAIRYFEKSMKLYSETYGLSSSKVADCLIGIGDVNYNQGREEEALKKYYEALEMKKKKCRDFHPDIAECFSKIADILKKQGKFQQAMQNHEESLRIFRNYYGDNHHQVAVTLNNIGVVLKKMGRMQESMQKYEESMEIYKKCYGKCHPKVADCLYNMAINLKNQGDLDGALQKYDESLEIYRQTYGDFHSEVVIVLEAIDNLIKNRAKKYHHKSE